MSKLKSVINELLSIKDEMQLEAHLLGLDLKDEWQELCHKIKELEQNMEQDLVSLAEKLGHAEEHHYVGNEEEIAALLEEFKNLRKKATKK